LRQADECLRNGRFEQARSELDSLAHLAPNDPDVLIRQVIAHGASNSPRAAAEAARGTLRKADMGKVLDIADGVWTKLDSEASQRVDVLVRGLLAKSAGYDAHFVGSSYQPGIELRFRDFARMPLSGEVIPESPLVYSVDPNPVFRIGVTPPPSAPITGKI